MNPSGPNQFDNTRQAAHNQSASGGSLGARRVALEHRLNEEFGQGPRATLEMRFRKDIIDRPELEAFMRSCTEQGWSVTPSRDGAQIVLEFSNPPDGALSLSKSQQGLLTSLVARIDRTIAGGFPGGSKSFRLIEALPYRVVHAAAGLMRLRGYGVTIELAGNATPRAIIFSIVPEMFGDGTQRSASDPTPPTGG